MNINELTIGQVKEIGQLLNNNGNKQLAFDNFKGKYVIARTRNAGVICGTVIEAGRGFLHMVEARRIYRVVSKDKSLSWYEGVASSGLHEEKGIISSAEEKFIVEDYELTICSNIATESLRGFKTNETTC